MLDGKCPSLVVSVGVLCILPLCYGTSVCHERAIGGTNGSSVVGMALRLFGGIMGPVGLGLGMNSQSP